MKKVYWVIIVILAGLSLTAPVLANSHNWSALSSGANDRIRAIAVAPSGAVYVAGSFTIIGGVQANRIAKWDGNNWTALGGGLVGGPGSRVEALALDSTGNLYAGGRFEQAGGVPANHIAKWDGSSWSALHSGTSHSVSVIAVDSSDNLYVGGWFDQAGGVAASSVAKWNGSSWSALGSGVSRDGGHAEVATLCLDPQGNLYVGGFFNRAGEITANHAAMWDGSSWSPLGNGMSASWYSEPARVYAMTCDAGGSLYAGGWFNRADGVPANRVARWDGQNWHALGTGVEKSFKPIDYGASRGAVYALELDQSGNLYVGGNFLEAGGLEAEHIAKWNGTDWSAISSGVTCEGTACWDYMGVQALGIDASRSLYAGGQFTVIDGVEANHIAKLQGAGAAMPGVMMLLLNE